jgi:hypothetical protein
MLFIFIVCVTQRQHLHVPYRTESPTNLKKSENLMFQILALKMKTAKRICYTTGTKALNTT